VGVKKYCALNVWSGQDCACIRRTVVLGGFSWFCNMMSHIRLRNGKITSEISVWLLHNLVDSVMTQRASSNCPVYFVTSSRTHQNWAWGMFVATLNAGLTATTRKWGSMALSNWCKQHHCHDVLFFALFHW